MYKLSNKANFYIRLSALMMIILFLIIDLITAIYFPMTKFSKLGYEERVVNYYSFFTAESNYMVVIYFCVYLFDAHFKGTKPSFQTRLAVTVYISITMLVFWLGIFTAEQDISEYNLYNWISTLILHLFMPIIMITSFILTSGHEFINFKQQYKIYLWLILIYPAIYCIIILIRGHLRYLDYMHSSLHPPHPQRETWYPYFFFDYSKGNYGWLLATVAVIVVFGLVISLQYFYIWINNLMYKHYQTREWRLQDFYQKILRKVNKNLNNKNKKNININKEIVDNNKKISSNKEQSDNKKKTDND